MAYLEDHRFQHTDSFSYDCRGDPQQDHVAASASCVAAGMFVQSIRGRRYRYPEDAAAAYHDWTAPENLNITGGARRANPNPNPNPSPKPASNPNPNPNPNPNTKQNPDPNSMAAPGCGLGATSLWPQRTAGTCWTCGDCWTLASL